MRGRRGRLPENWWARRWIEVLEGFEVGRRLGRGRNYARQGQVTELELGKGFITAKVQGSRDAPYLVRMRLSMLSSTDWKKVIRALGEDAQYASRLVAGEIPENIERVFQDLELSLFPSANGDLKTACSCPDQANPCKHVAAVYYLLGEEFDRDPFLIFRLRGIERGELLEAIREGLALRGASLPATRDETAEAEALPEGQERAPEEREAQPEAGETEREEPVEPVEPESAPFACAPAEARSSEPEPLPTEPLPTEPHDFWTGSGSAADDHREVRIPAVAAALPKRLGGLSFWHGEQDLTALLERIYRNASVAGLDVFVGAPEVHDETGSG
ncbi:MAG TPA: SWIM zinc finger family protein [Myxococcota bacterium]